VLPGRSLTSSFMVLPAAAWVVATVWLQVAGVLAGRGGVRTRHGPASPRIRGAAPRHRQVVVRFSDVELALVAERAELAGLAVGAWIGATAVEAARAGGGSVGLPDLLRLHADVASVGSAAGVVGVGRDQVVVLLARLDAAVDAVVAEIERSRR